MAVVDRNKKWPVRIKPTDVVLAAALFLLVCLYGLAGWTVALVSALVFEALTLAGKYIYGYVRRIESFPYVRVAYILVAVFIALDGVLAVYTVAYGEMGVFLHDAAIYLAAALAAWAGIVTIEPVVEEEDDEQSILPVSDIETPLPGPVPVKDNGKITVKKGNSIHIIETCDVLYISAMGDYVSIVTPGGRFVKEGTMAYFEQALGDGFLRIHRSTIVNVGKISSVELYGKQSYNVRLCNGESVKTSASGYRALRETLNK